MTFEQTLAALKDVGLPTWTRDDEAAMLWRCAERAPGPVVELGCFCGYTAAMMAAARPPDSGPVYTIDPFPVRWWEKWLPPIDLPCERTIDLARPAWEALGLTDRIVVIEVACELPEALAQVPAEIGLLYIDAEHDDESVQQHLDLYMPRVVPGGWVAFDDWEETADWHVRQLARAWMTADRSYWWHRESRGKMTAWQRDADGPS